jgi:hypothetical protein
MLPKLEALHIPMSDYFAVYANVGNRKPVLRHSCNVFAADMNRALEVARSNGLATQRGSCAVRIGGEGYAEELKKVSSKGFNYDHS